MVAQKDAVELAEKATTVAELVNIYPGMKAMCDDLARITEDTDSTQAGQDAASIMESILSAETEEGVFAAQEGGSLSTQDYVNKPFRLLPENVQFRKSTIEGQGLPFYALMRVTDEETGDELVVNGGGNSFVSVLWKLIQLGALEGYGKSGGRMFMVAEKGTQSGFTVLLLKPLASKRDDA